MRIESSTMALSSQHSLTETRTRHETLRAGVVTGAWGQEGNREDTVTRERQSTPSPSGASSSRSLLDEYLGPRRAAAARQGTQVSGRTELPSPGDLRESLQPEGLDLLQQIEGLAMSATTAGSSGLSQPPVPAADQLKMDLIRSTVEAFTGRALKLLDLSALTGQPAAQEAASEADTPYHAESDEEQASDEPRFGLEYSLRETRTERETANFQAQGVVRTADGREIAIDVQLTMDREFVQETSSEVRMGAALEDPLVVNFSGTAAELTQRTFAFDLDANGDTEDIHFVGPGSGFLAWDRNGNDTVDDGSELFGPSTGQGFSELAANDDDGNGFIDEGDDIYGSLRIWEKDSAGNDRLVGLQARGVGAIYLGSAATPFQVKDNDGALQGMVRSSGVWLGEHGGAGTVQQLDLVV